MISRRKLMEASGFSLGAAALAGVFFSDRVKAMPESKGAFPVSYSDAEWRKRLTPSQYNVLRREGTERPFSSPLNNEHRAGVFVCAACSEKLYRSETKFESGTGWPSFYQPIVGTVTESADRSLGFTRTEVHCANCGGHLGHVFDDGPKPTGLRYCMNGVAMEFHAA